MTTLWLDTETYSEVDLFKAGLHRYAEDPSTEITVVQWAIDDGEPTVVDCTTNAHLTGELAPLYAALHDPETLIYAHNAQFDRTLIRHVWGIDIPVERWRCTMVQAMVHALPGALGKLGPILGMPVDLQKDRRGDRLVKMFCKPNPANWKTRRNTRLTHPKEWQEFLEYSRQDIVSMREMASRLPTWNWQEGGRVQKLWFLDQHINDRGFAVDVDLAKSAVEATKVEKDRIDEEMHDATDGEVSGASKRADLLTHILMEYGVVLKDTKADTLRKCLDDPDLPEGVKLLISLRLEGTKTSTAKYASLLRAVSRDHRLRGGLQFSGAQRTMRWAGRLYQPQNMPRPSHGFGKPELDLAVAALKSGVASELYTNVMQLTADTVRGCIVAPPGKKLVVADLSNIEGRGLAWLAGEKWKLQAFSAYDAGEGPDLYVMAYARAFQADPDTVEKWQRQIGKVMELGLGYEGGVAAFLTFAAVYQMDLDGMADAVHRTAPKDALAAAYGMWEWASKRKRTLGLSKSVYVACEVLKTAWREAHPATVSLWRELGDGVVNATLNPGVTYTAGPHLKIRRDGSWLRIRLPSGRYLCYLRPEVDENGSWSYMGVNQYTRQWTRIKSYGGKLCIAEGSLVLTDQGWTKIEEVTSVHKVWDGVEWVSTDGYICNGEKEVIEAHGAWMTPDHLVLTTEGWKDASQSKGYNRAACRLPDGVTLPRQQREEVVVGAGVRLRSGENHGPQRVQEAGQARCSGLVRLQAQGIHQRQEQNPRHVQAPGVRRLAQHVRPLQAAVASGLAQLWSAWHYSVRALAGIVRELLGGHGADVPARAYAGSQRQQPGVQPRELRVGDGQSASQQHAQQRDCQRPHSIATGGGAGHQALDDVLPTAGGRTVRAARGEARLFAQVYDLVNCGPRHRFVILAGGAPLIVHNCENATQAWALDVLTENMHDIEQSGYKIVLSVHDELLTECPDKPEFTAETLGLMMSHRPQWAPDVPLAAAGFETDRYYKD